MLFCNNVKALNTFSLFAPHLVLVFLVLCRFYFLETATRRYKLLLVAT